MALGCVSWQLMLLGQHLMEGTGESSNKHIVLFSNRLCHRRKAQGWPQLHQGFSCPLSWVLIEFSHLLCFLGGSLKAEISLVRIPSGESSWYTGEKNLKFQTTPFTADPASSMIPNQSRHGRGVPLFRLKSNWIKLMG